MKIGLFDSGIGGTTILKRLQEKFPDEEYNYIADSKNCPYGEKTDKELKNIVSLNTKSLIDWGAKIIVVACNTATTRCIAYLRANFPDVEFVGTEPAIKLAADTNAKRILVMATPGTAKSERINKLLRKYRKPRQRIDLLPCPGLADIIEKNYPTKNYEPIIEQLHLLLKDVDYSPDIVVLGCTHYPLIKNLIQPFFANAKLIDGNDGVVRQVEKILKNFPK